jgi:methylmalonyl-CoA/ethylmalonyl-CoA epimerase
MLLANRTVSHIAYAVSDIEKAAHDWSSTLGAGPFVIIERMKFDQVLHHGKACVFDHSAAFGQWGPIVIELQQIFASAPATLTERLIPGPPPVINHVAYISPEPEADSAQLAAAGYELFLYAKFSEVEVRFHDTRAILGQAIEIHRQCRFLEEFFGQIAGAARGWDGTAPLRPWK